MTSIDKVIIPVAGKGTRLLSATKEQPKEMLPIFSKTCDGNLCIKPIVQYIFEQLFDSGFRQFYFIVGRNKRAIEDHFTQDASYVNSLRHNGKSSYADELSSFYTKLSASTIVWINQPEPLGFGHAVLMAASFFKDESFLVHAGDTILGTGNAAHIRKILNTHGKLDASATLLVRYVQDPRQFGVVTGKREKNDSILVSSLIEKPEKPPSHLAIMPAYLFQPEIFAALRKTPYGKGNELQLTDGIMELVNENRKVIAVEMDKNDPWIDIGTPTTYWQALIDSHKKATT